jgi:hypothetical protein
VLPPSEVDLREIPAAQVLKCATGNDIWAYVPVETVEPEDQKKMKAGVEK